MTLIDKVIKQIEEDVRFQDFMALEVLLQHIPDHILEGFLSECDGPQCGFCASAKDPDEEGNPSY